MSRLSLAPLVAVLATSCATPPVAAPRLPGRPVVSRAEFPSAEEVEALARAPSPARVASERQRDVDAWSLARPPDAAPEDVSHAPAGPWDGLLATVAAERPGLLWASEPMACLAREAGLFHLATQGTPEPEALGFMASRCGVGEPALRAGWVVQPLSGGEADARILERLRARVLEALRRALPRGSQAAGLWYGRDGGRAVVFFVFGPHRVRFEAFPEVPAADGSVAVRGELLVPAARAQALVTRGRRGVRSCAPDPAVRLPRFAFRCEVDPSDDSARLELAAFPAGRLTGPVVATAWLWPRGVRSGRYVRPAVASAPPAPADASLATGLLRQLNGVRAEIGLPPVRLEVEQSETAARLAPRYFAAGAGPLPEVERDPVVLGLRAGWRVKGRVAEGHFTSALVRDRDAARVLSAALERPSGREALLDPRVSAVAVGVLEAPGERLTGAVFGTYRLVDPDAADREAGEVVRRVDAARQARGLSAVAALSALRPAAATLAQGVEQGERTPEAAVKALANEAAGAVKGAALSWFAAADRLERVELPEPLVTTPGLRLAVGVAHYRQPGAPWFTTGVLFVAVAPAR